MLLFSIERAPALHFAIEGLQCKWLASEKRVSKSAHPSVGPGLLRRPSLDFII